MSTGSGDKTRKGLFSCAKTPNEKNKKIKNPENFQRMIVECTERGVGSQSFDKLRMSENQLTPAFRGTGRLRSGRNIAGAGARAVSGIRNGNGNGGDIDHLAPPFAPDCRGPTPAQTP